MEEMMAKANAAQASRHHDDAEHRLQCSCVEWYCLQHYQYRHCLFAVPNGGGRSKGEAGRLKAEGVQAGVSDLILMRKTCRYGALLIEMKTTKGRQSASQKEWQRSMESEGYKYVVCRSLDDFIAEVESYFAEIELSRNL